MTIPRSKVVPLNSKLISKLFGKCIKYNFQLSRWQLFILKTWHLFGWYSYFNANFVPNFSNIICHFEEPIKCHFSTLEYNFAPSTNNFRLHLNISGKSLIYNKNRMEPKTLPCGAPLKTSNKLNIIPPITSITL